MFAVSWTFTVIWRYRPSSREAGLPFTAIPAFPHRRFRHSYMFVNSRAGINRPADLAGKRVALRTWQTTAGVWMRGILASDYGVDPDRVEWITFEDPHVAEYRDPAIVKRAPAGKELVQMLLDGEIDALLRQTAISESTDAL